MRNAIIDNKINYIRNVFVEEDELLLKIKADAKAVNRPININPEDGKLLQILIKISGSKKILEIGTFYGYSTLWLARSLGDDGIIYTIEKDRESCLMAKQNFLEAKMDKKIMIVEARAEEIMPTWIGKEQFDMIFIDAEKNHYLDYLQSAEQLLKSGGLLVADNTLLSGAVYSEELPYRIRKGTRDVMVEFNRRLADKSKYTSILIPAEDGITVAVKK